MIRKVALCACWSILTACATHSSPPPAPAADQPAPLAADPRLCATVPAEPRLPAGASIPQPVTDEERAAVALFLTWNADVLGVLRQLRARAEVARAGCGPGGG